MSYAVTCIKDIVCCGSYSLFECGPEHGVESDRNDTSAGGALTGWNAGGGT